MNNQTPKAVFTTKNRDTALRAMESKLREISHEAQTHQVFRLRFDSLIVGCHYVDETTIVEVAEGYRTVLKVVLDPTTTGKYCDGRVAVVSWTRGEWEKLFGARVDVYDPKVSDVVPPWIAKVIRHGSKMPLRSESCVRALEALTQCLPEPFDDMVRMAMRREVSVGDSLDIPVSFSAGPKIAVAITYMLALNQARPSHVKKAWHSALTLAESRGQDGIKIALELGGRASFNWLMKYLQWTSPSEKYGDFAYTIFHASGGGAYVSSRDNGHLIDKIALALENAGISVP